MEAFHIFVAIYAEKNPQEICNLMAYAQIVQRISEACWDAAALSYDDRFRLWRQRDPKSYPWQQKKVEFYQETVFAGLDFKLKAKHNSFVSLKNAGTASPSIIKARVPIDLCAPTYTFASIAKENINPNNHRLLKGSHQKNYTKSNKPTATK